MTDLIFNELSVKPLCETKAGAFERVKDFVATFKAANKFHFNKIRFEDAFDEIFLAPAYTLNDFCNDHRTMGTLLRGLSRYPFIDDDSVEEKRYIENAFFIQMDGKKWETYGLAAAYLYSTIGIGYLSAPRWREMAHTLEIQGEEKRAVTVLCVAEPDHFKTVAFREWLDENTEIELVECDISPANKKIVLRDDHGKDTLLKFARKIVKSPYVIGVINSIPFNPHEKKIIRKLSPAGNIEIVLPDTDQGLGMALKTTGRNLRETKAIAEIIRNKYVQ
ncbi:conserved hypothetical protein [Candidatus Desulfarcum epimagneticum]|uniref:Uncharacterized protein n=1 Tax=uncultured Desulfobacteraceae bacterium TaxID=218296 RepID=A0A484HJM2_9BACT|nr:conserved hypothetical protein [uncultured Desulfobacteraceae bacterium]